MTILFANRRKSRRNIKKPVEDLQKYSSTKELFSIFSSSSDFINQQETFNGMDYWVSFYRPLIDTLELHKSVLSVLPTLKTINLEQIKENIPIENMLITSEPEEIKKRIMRGDVAIRLATNLEKCLLISIC